MTKLASQSTSSRSPSWTWQIHYSRICCLQWAEKSIQCL